MGDLGVRWLQIPGVPFAWKRTGSSRPVTLPDGRKFSHRYQPKDQVDWKAWAKLNMAQCMGGARPMTGPVAVTILAVFPMPTGRRLKRSKRPRSYYEGQKDIDNVGKAILDAGNQTLWHDDRQVAIEQIYAVVGAQDEPARVEVSFAPPPPVETVPQTLRPGG